MSFFVFRFMGPLSSITTWEGNKGGAYNWMITVYD